MENKVLNLLNEFSWGLQGLSSEPIKDFEIVLPYQAWRNLEEELFNTIGWIQGNENLREVTQNVYELVEVNGVKIKISCKEINEQLLKSKLQECFKILST